MAILIQENAFEKFACSMTNIFVHENQAAQLAWFNLKIIAWISKHMPSEMWDESTYPFPNLSGCIAEVWEWISNSISHVVMDVLTYPWGP